MATLAITFHWIRYGIALAGFVGSWYVVLVMLANVARDAAGVGQEEVLQLHLVA